MPPKRRASPVPVLAEGQAEPQPQPQPQPELAALRVALVRALGTHAIAKSTTTSMSLGDDATLRRFLSAKGGDAAAACTAICETLAWRAEFGVDRLVQDCWPTIQKEAADGKVFVSGRDYAGRPILWVRAAAERTFDNKGKKSGNLINLVYHIERAIAAMDAEGCPDQQWVLL